VANAANTLTGIARDLANDEYEDYPEIQSEITQACDGEYCSNPFLCLSHKSEKKGEKNRQKKKNNEFYARSSPYRHFANPS
jgi:hypothetical protein